MIKVYLGIASRNSGQWGMFDSVLRNLQTSGRKGIKIIIEPHIGDSAICRARNEMTWKFLQTDCTHFMQLDDDIQLPEDGIVKLAEADKPVIGGAYRLKDMKKYTGEASQARDEGYRAALRAFSTFDIKEHSNKIIKIKYLSTGCFLQKREVIEKMWEQYSNLKYWANLTEIDKDERRALYMPMIHKTEYLSEDWAYCQRVVDIGYSMWLHTGVVCGHWGLYNYTF